MVSGSEFPLPEAPFLHLYSSGQDQLPLHLFLPDPRRHLSAFPYRRPCFPHAPQYPGQILSLRLPVSDPAQGDLCGYQIQDLCPRCKDSPGCQHRDPAGPQTVPVSAPFSSSTSHIRLPAFLPAIGIFVISVCLLPFCYLSSLLSSRFLGGFGPKNW